MIDIILFIIGGYFLIGFLLGVNTLRKTKTETNISQKTVVIFGAMIFWGYFFGLGIKRFKDGNRK